MFSIIALLLIIFIFNCYQFYNLLFQPHNELYDGINRIVYIYDDLINNHEGLTPLEGYEVQPSSAWDSLEFSKTTVGKNKSREKQYKN